MTNISAEMSISILRCNQILITCQEILKYLIHFENVSNYLISNTRKTVQYISDNFEHILKYIILPYIKVV